ncbi:MAG TPA: SPFH domain-containing protein, partial [Gemmatimonadales bacterium]|nr:SPFH domain-containing protein [Gemmatimonadales bacterium]
GGGILLLLIVLAAHKKVLRLFGVVIVPEDSVGIVTKRFVLLGSTRTLPDGRIIALRGEDGIQADTLAPGLHWWLWPWQYATTLQRFVVLPEGSIGIVEARDGAPIAVGRVLGKRVSCDSFQNARAFLSNGGERGPQLAVIPPGSYRINTALFVIKPCPAIEIPSDRIGLVETMEGTSLSTASGDITGPVIEGHTSFQDAQAFVDHHGRKGLQEEVLLPGRYFINPKFAQVEVVDMTVVPIAHVGVVISYVGTHGEDVTGVEFKHGNMVLKGQRGVWVEPLDPGKYPINPRTTKLEMVPTANVVLNWATGKTEAHKLDERLSSITVRSQDGFTFNLDVSQIIHIPRNAAPKVIARFGSMANLVTQVLEPTIGNYFRNAAQKSDVIDFLKERVNRQSEARQAITTALTEYDVGAVDTLIGDIVPPEALMKTLTDRKLAEQERVTYGTQKQAQEVRKELAQAQAQADTQPQVVNAERQVEIASFEAQTRIKRAEGDAQSKRINAQADANVLQLVGEAEGKKITAVGNAEAEVLKLKGEAINPGNYATIEVAKALASSGMKLVPDVVAGGGGNGGGGSLVDVLLAQLITGKLVAQPPETRK